MISQGLHEIVLIVSDVTRSAAFYRDVMGLIDLGDPDEEWAAFATISKEHKQWIGIHKGKLLFEEHSPRPEGQRFGPSHFALRGDRSLIEDFLKRCLAAGVKVHGPHKFSGRMEGLSYYVYDPDDNLVEFWFPA